MRKIVIALILAAAPAWVYAAEHNCGLVDCKHVKIDLSDQASLQRGARTFVNYCLSCHSAQYMRYNQMGKDLGISDKLVKENMLFAQPRVGELMKVAMTTAQGNKWFGKAPPDLTLEARYRGSDWIYTYLTSFYVDKSTNTGWNNLVFPHVAMPDVLWELQGFQHAVFKKDKEGSSEFDHFELAKPGTMSPKEYDSTIRDLTNYFVYMGEPAKLVRYRIGVYVMIFLAIFFVFAWFLKKEYWKDVH